MSKIFIHKFSTKAEQRRAASRSYAPYIADLMSIGRNVRAAIAALKPGQAIDLRYKELTDRIVFDHPKHDNVVVVRRFRMKPELSRP